MPRTATVSVWGIGGAGGVAVATLLAAGFDFADMIVADGDPGVLDAAPFPARVPLAPLLRAPAAIAGVPSVLVDAAARRTAEAIASRLEGRRLCILVSGLGGATGRAAAPLVAATARARGIATLAIVAIPEGDANRSAAAPALAAIEAAADHLLVLNGREEAALRSALADILIALVAGQSGGAGDPGMDWAVATMAVSARRLAGETRAHAPAPSVQGVRPAPRIAACYRTGQGPELMPLRTSAHA